MWFILYECFVHFYMHLHMEKIQKINIVSLWRGKKKQMESIGINNAGFILIFINKF